MCGSPCWKAPAFRVLYARRFLLQSPVPETVAHPPLMVDDDHPVEVVPADGSGFSHSLPEFVHGFGDFREHPAHVPVSGERVEEAELSFRFVEAD